MIFFHLNLFSITLDIHYSESQVYSAVATPELTNDGPKSLVPTWPYPGIVIFFTVFPVLRFTSL